MPDINTKKIRQAFNSFIREVFGLVGSPLEKKYVRESILIFLATLLILISVNLFQKLLLSGQLYLNTLRKVKSLESQLNSTQKSFGNIEKTPQAAEDLLDSLPANQDSHRLLERINLLSNRHELALLNISFLPSVETSKLGLVKQPILISLSGRFENILAFIEEVEENKRPIVVATLNFSLPEKSLNSGVVGVDLTADSFFENLVN